MNALYHMLTKGLLREGNPDDDGGGGDPPPLLNENLEFAEGYQERVGEFAEGSTFKTLPDLFKSVKEGTRALTQANTEKAELTKQLEELKGQKPKEYTDADAFTKDVLLPKEMPDGVEVPESVVSAAVSFAMEKGYPPSAVSDFLAFQVQAAGEDLKAINTEKFTLAQAAKAEIQSIVGAENYDVTVENAKAAVKTLNLPVNEETLLSNPSLVVTMHKLATHLEPGTLQSAGLIAPDNRAGAKSKIAQAEDIVMNPENPLHAAFNNPADARHDDAVAEHSRLIAESVS